jgi:hypothetical protein
MATICMPMSTMSIQPSTTPNITHTITPNTLITTSTTAINNQA